MRLGLLCGSFRSDSSNQAALRVVDQAGEARGVDMVWIEGLPELPTFDPDQVDDPPLKVAHFQAQLRDVDGLIIAAPEYAAGVAGSTKNALDWLVGAAAIYQTPVAIISAGTTGGPLAIEQLVRTLSWQGAWPMASLGISASKTKMDADEFVDPATTAALNDLLALMDELVRGSADGRRGALARTVEPFGIDVARFGEIV